MHAWHVAACASWKVDGSGGRDPPDGTFLSWQEPVLTALGKPPSFETITRDTFAAGTSFTAAFVRNVAASIASALAHVHKRQIAHGDLYAHNVLVNDDGSGAKLADFGAAYYYGGGGALEGHAREIEGMEQRAFGFLLSELLERCADTDTAAALLAPVREAARLCAVDENATAERPGFAQLEELLQLPAAMPNGEDEPRKRTRFERF